LVLNWENNKKMLQNSDAIYRQFREGGVVTLCSRKEKEKSVPQSGGKVGEGVRKKIETCGIK